MEEGVQVAPKARTVVEQVEAVVMVWVVEETGLELSTNVLVEVVAEP